MELVKIKHSESKNAWNIIGDIAGGKYKIARIPYHQNKEKGMEMYNTREKAYALNDAEFISFCLNNRQSILDKKRTF
jgi:hypothetical protein|tara:strand:+ start:59 stop:289 length:231 start_codon:yes stop_codon:yes gene_type:complete